MEVRYTSIAIMGPGGSEAIKSSSISTERRGRRGERGKRRYYVRCVAGRPPSQIVKGWSELVNQQQQRDRHHQVNAGSSPCRSY
jgi:hypothetical protein